MRGPPVSIVKESTGKSSSPKVYLSRLGVSLGPILSSIARVPKPWTAQRNSQRRGLWTDLRLTKFPISMPGVRNPQVTFTWNALFRCKRAVFGSICATAVQPGMRRGSAGLFPPCWPMLWKPS